jgi:hypothetical protein
VVVESSYQVFDIARTKNVSEHTFLLMCHSASCILHAIAQVDEATSKSSNVVQQWNDRSKTFQKMKRALKEWIIREDVIGSCIFGGSRRKYYRGKEELEVCNVLIISILIK